MWLDEWQLEVEQLSGTATEKEKMLLSKETLTGLKITGMYFITKYIVSRVFYYFIF